MSVSQNSRVAMVFPCWIGNFSEESRECLLLQSGTHKGLKGVPSPRDSLWFPCLLSLSEFPGWQHSPTYPRRQRSDCAVLPTPVVGVGHQKWETIGKAHVNFSSKKDPIAALIPANNSQKTDDVASRRQSFKVTRSISSSPSLLSSSGTSRGSHRCLRGMEISSEEKRWD